MTGQSDRQTHMQGCQCLQLCTGSGSTPGHWGGSFESCCTCSPAALELPPPRKVQLGGRFQGPDPPARIVLDGPLNCQPARTKFRCACRGAFPAPFPACGQAPSLLEAHKFLNTNFQSWHDCGSFPRSGLRVLCAEYSQEAAYIVRRWVVMYFGYRDVLGQPTDPFYRLRCQFKEPLASVLIPWRSSFIRELPK